MTIPLLAFALLCPPDGEVYNAFLLMRVYKAPGILITSAPIQPGTVLNIHADLVYMERDAMFRKGIAFSGGTMKIRVHGEDLPFDLTPTGGIPTLGPSECGGVPVWSTNISYAVTVPTQYITAEYEGMLNLSAITALRVAPFSPVAISKSAQSVNLSFLTVMPSVEIQASTNAVDWATVDTAIPVNGRVEWTTATEGTNKMFRLKL